MRKFHGAELALLLCGLGSLCGCGGSPAPKASEQLPAWLAEEPVRSMAATSQAKAMLTLNLKVGEQFPLRKVVEQELRQDSLSGTPRVDRSRLEVTFAVTVKARAEERTQLAVRYDRVRYVHDIADEHVEFDSATPAAVVPAAMLPYQDMIRDGFTFWIGADNQIAQVDGLQEFMDRALRNVPPAQRQQVVLGIEAGSGESGLANFVDNSIGLLPYGKPASPGDTWQKQQHISVPVPMTANNTYILKEVDDKLAVIDIRGDIIPSTVVNSVRSGDNVQVTVNGGNTLGSCTIFRETGLPRDSRVDRTVDMTVTLAGAVKFRQVKRVVTLIESYPSTSAPATIIGRVESEPGQLTVSR